MTRAAARLLALAGVTAGALVGAAAPSSANHQCSEAFGVCFVTDPVTIPAGTPVIPPTGTGPDRVPGPRLCDSSTGQCVTTYVLLPTASIASNGGTVASIAVPSYGVSVSRTGQVTVYYAVPPAPVPGSPGVTVEAWVPYAPLYVEPDDRKCPPVSVPPVGPVEAGTDLLCYA